MPGGNRSTERLTEIILLLRPARPHRLPESLTAAATLGDVERMQLFLDRGANIEERSAGHASPLAAACAAGQVEAARWLVAHGANVDPPGAIVSPVQAALSKGHCAAAAVLLDAGLPIERAAWGAIVAATLGRLDMLHWLVGRGLDLDKAYPQLGVLRAKALASLRKDGDPALGCWLRGESDPGAAPATPPASLAAPVQPRAPTEDRAALVQETLDLIRDGGKTLARGNATGPAASKRESLLAYAAGHDVAEIVSALLDAGAEPGLAPDGTPPPLYRAAEEAALDAMRILLARGAAPDGQDGKTWVPLAGAALSGEPAAVTLLLEAGAKATAKPAGGRTIAEHARGPYAAEIRALLDAAAAKKGAAKPKRKT